ncbi:MAG: hypothetical protein DRN71_03755 [Candidatus Nanohalarchaeota archaeon]|nr:MAG: hypothetical protein DRN71_03755 [Candidatus Nanohaloarchaeota archaeon]
MVNTGQARTLLKYIKSHRDCMLSVCAALYHEPITFSDFDGVYNEIFDGNAPETIDSGENFRNYLIKKRIIKERSVSGNLENGVALTDEAKMAYKNYTNGSKVK